MKRVLLVLNKPNRELVIMNAIRREIALLAPDAVVKILPYSWRFRDDVLEFKPDVVLTFPMTSVGLAEPYYIFKRMFGTRVVCFRAEGIIDPASPQSIANHVGYDRYGPMLVDYELFWGPGPARLIGDELVARGKLSSPQRVECFGYPRLERYFNIAPPDGLMRLDGPALSKLSAYGRERTILFATGFHFANYTRAAIFGAKDLNAEKRCDELLAIIEEVKVFRAGWIEAIRRGASENPDLLFVLKKHPIERKEDYAALGEIDNILYVWQDMDIADLMERAALFFHYGSTSLVDAYLAGVPGVYVYSHDRRCREWFPDLGWPSARSIPWDEIPAIVQEFRGGAVAANHAKEIQTVLEFNFNIRNGADYRPSRDIAALLLRNEPAQRVPYSDPHLWRALGRHYYLRLRRIIGRPIRDIVRRVVRQF